MGGRRPGTWRGSQPHHQQPVGLVKHCGGFHLPVADVESEGVVRWEREAVPVPRFESFPRDKMKTPTWALHLFALVYLHSMEGREDAVRNAARRPDDETLAGVATSAKELEAVVLALRILQREGVFPTDATTRLHLTAEDAEEYVRTRGATRFVRSSGKWWALLSSNSTREALRRGVRAAEQGPESADWSSAIGAYAGTVALRRRRVAALDARLAETDAQLQRLHPWLGVRVNHKIQESPAVRYAAVDAQRMATCAYAVDARAATADRAVGSRSRAASSSSSRGGILDANALPWCPYQLDAPRTSTAVSTDRLSLFSCSSSFGQTQIPRPVTTTSIQKKKKKDHFVKLWRGTRSTPTTMQPFFGTSGMAVSVETPLPTVTTGRASSLSSSSSSSSSRMMMGRPTQAATTGLADGGDHLSLQSQSLALEERTLLSSSY